MAEIEIPADQRALAATLHRPAHPCGLVLLVHGAGTDRHDAGDLHVAAELGEAGFATLQPELLDPRQAIDPSNAVDVELQCARLLPALEWLEGQPWAGALPLGLFGGGIGSGVVLLAAAARPQRIGALVCCDGRPDTALFRAPSVGAPTLLLAEADDWPYRQVYEALAGPKDLVVIPRLARATGAVRRQAKRWFLRYLKR